MFYLSCGQNKGIRKPWGKKNDSHLEYPITALELRVRYTQGYPHNLLKWKKTLGKEDIRINLRNILGENWEKMMAQKSYIQIPLEEICRPHNHMQNTFSV